MPPMPEASATATRSGSVPSAVSSPASAHASRAATRASCPERSSRRALTRSRTAVGSTATSAAIWVPSCAAHSCLRTSTPDRPDSSASQVVGTSPPTGEVAPRPVTRTLVLLIVLFPYRGRRGSGCGPSNCVTLLDGLGRRCRSGLGLLDEGDGVTDGLEVLDLVVGDADTELLLGGHDDLDHRQGVDVEVVDERLVGLDIVGSDAGDVLDDRGEVGLDLGGACHGGSFVFVVFVSRVSSSGAAVGGGSGRCVRGRCGRATLPESL